MKYENDIIISPEFSIRKNNPFPSIPELLLGVIMRYEKGIISSYTIIYENSNR